MTTAPSLAKLRFLPGFEDPLDVWGKCQTALKEWPKLSCELLDEFNKKAVVKSIWTANVLEDTLPKGTERNRSEEVLSKAYEDTYEDTNVKVSAPAWSRYQACGSCMSD